ncbi:MAG: hypothetical protein IJY04_01570, partial [Clostridia bacterium]|nr:hypothetical protein [Clostridia bacterium]
LWKIKTMQSWDVSITTKVNLVTMRNITVLPPDGSDVVTSYNLTEKYDISEPGEYGITAPCFELSFNVISTPFDDTIMECDSASFDIDGDGEDEICTVGLTNYGLFSFTFAVREVGQVENRHFTVFYTDPMSDLRFVKNAESGKTQLHAVLGSDGTTLLFDLAVENGRISITSDGKPIEELN